MISSAHETLLSVRAMFLSSLKVTMATESRGMVSGDLTGVR
jgi:hypothetical protein